MLGEVLKEDDAKVLIGEIIKSEVPNVPKTKRKAIDFLSDMLPHIFAVAAKYQNEVVRLLSNPAEQPGTLGSLTSVQAEFVKFTTLLTSTASVLARYESPTYKAIFLQQDMPQPAAPSNHAPALLDAQAERDPARATQTYLRLIAAPKAA